LIRRVPIETKINHERWLVSYSDFITLLFAFFVVMYSVSQVSEAKYKELSITLSKAFEGSANVAANSSPESALPESESAEQQINSSPQNELADLSQVQKEMETALEGLVQQSRVVLSGNEDWVEIEINSNLIFSSAEAELSDEAKTIFTDIADVLAPYENAVEVSGHTDDIPISNSSFANNWELSSARAVSVVNWLAYNGVKPERLSAVGYGEYRPIADNTTENGRAANRRVVLRVARDRAEQPKQQAQALMENDGTPTSVGEETLTEKVIDQSPETTPSESDTKIEPIKLENGGLLFTNDPNSPRNNR